MRQKRLYQAGKRGQIWKHRDYALLVVQHEARLVQAVQQKSLCQAALEGQKSNRVDCQEALNGKQQMAPHVITANDTEMFAKSNANSVPACGSSTMIGVDIAPRSAGARGAGAG